ncbi:LPS translocon maturation chaperone LptM [Spirabiliibacterium pneumoniae]|nr:lipoprotein [Spirabiliibacterium pneumoniae]
MKTAMLTALAALCLFSLVSCGVKGALYFPTDNASTEQTQAQ